VKIKMGETFSKVIDIVRGKALAKDEEREREKEAEEEEEWYKSCGGDRYETEDI
jgi:hypothetical protein